MIEVFDFEATGLGDPKATQIGKCRLDKKYQLIKSTCKSAYINPEKDITWGAMGITGITNEMVADKPTIEEVLPKFKIHPSTKYVVCHNMTFDEKFFPEGFIPDDVKLLCTLKLARKLIPKGESGDHKNTTLFYYLGCYKDPFGKEFIGDAHSALPDALMTANVLVSMLEKYSLTVDEAYALIAPKVNNIEVCDFNKYKDQGKKWVDLVQEDLSYVQWLLANVKWNDEKEQAFVESLISNE